MDVLHTERMRLRRFTPGDVDILTELDSDPAVMRFINNGVPTPRDEIAAEVLPYFLRLYERRSGYGYWAAVERASDDFLGWFHLRPEEGHAPGEPELGYRLRRAVWGRGYATEGARALIDRAFVDLGALRVYATTMVINTASRRVMEKAGMRFVRTFVSDWPVAIDGDEFGDVEYAITRAEWEADRAFVAGNRNTCSRPGGAIPYGTA